MARQVFPLADRRVDSANWATLCRAKRIREVIIRWASPCRGLIVKLRAGEDIPPALSTGCVTDAFVLGPDVAAASMAGRLDMFVAKCVVVEI